MSSGIHRGDLTVIGLLAQGRRLGRDLKDDLEARSYKISPQAFSRRMNRLEQAGYLESESGEMSGGKAEERTYRLTRQGIKTLEDSRDYVVDLKREESTLGPEDWPSKLDPL